MASGAAKVTFTEKDVSFFYQGVTQGRHCAQITARRGPVNKVQLVGSVKQFQEIYGLPLDSSDSDLVIGRALDRGAVLYLNRVVHYTDPRDASSITATLASLTLLDNQGRDTLRIEAANEGTWGNTLTITITESPIDTNRFDLRVEFSEQSDLNESFEYLTMNQNDSDHYAIAKINQESKLIQVTDLEAGDPFENDSVTIGSTSFSVGRDFVLDINDPAQMASSLAEAINEALDDVLASVTSTTIEIQALTAGVEGNLIALATESVGGNISVSAPTLSGGTDATLASGTLNFGAPSDLDTLTINETTFTYVTATPESNQFNTIDELTALINDLDFVSAAHDGTEITITATTAGEAGNTIALATISETGLTISGPNLTGGLDATFATGTIRFATDPVTVDNPAPIDSINLTGGNDGLAELDDDDWIGSSATNTGLFAFDDVEDAFGLASPEATSPTVITAGIAYCEKRKDLIYYFEAPASVDSAAEAVDFRLGRGIWTHPAFNSSYAAMYFGRPKVRSPKTNKIVDISVIGDVFGAHAFSNKKAELWFAAAGLNRGRIPNTLGVHYNVGTNGRAFEMDELVDQQINPIVNFDDLGTYVWGNQTVQRAPSATQSLSIRKLLIFMKKALLKTNQVFLFEPNDTTLWRQVHNTLEPWMQDLENRRAFYDSQIFCDQDARKLEEAILNTPERVDRGEFICRIFIKPKRHLKHMGIEAVITKSSANFTELLDVRL